jgi:hypothetical protein
MPYNTLLVRGPGVEEMLAALPSLADGAADRPSVNEPPGSRAAAAVAAAAQEPPLHSGAPIGGVADLCASPRGHHGAGAMTHQHTMNGGSSSMALVPPLQLQAQAQLQQQLSAVGGGSSSGTAAAATKVAVGRSSSLSSPAVSSAATAAVRRGGSTAGGDAPAVNEDVEMHRSPRMRTIMTSLHLDAAGGSFRDGADDAASSVGGVSGSTGGHRGGSSSTVPPPTAAATSPYVSSKAFDVLEAWVFEQLRSSAHEAYLASKWHAQYLNYYYLQFQPISEDSFILFRVLGRGGFGAVNGCKRGTTGKLYAMKVRERVHAAKSMYSSLWASCYGFRSAASHDGDSSSTSSASDESIVGDSSDNSGSSNIGVVLLLWVQSMKHSMPASAHRVVVHVA